MGLPGIGGGGDQGGASGAGAAGGANPLDTLKKLDPLKKLMGGDKGGHSTESQQVGNAAAAGPG